MRYWYLQVLACCFSTMCFVSNARSISDNVAWRRRSTTASRLSNVCPTSCRELAWLSVSSFMTACIAFKDCKTSATGRSAVCCNSSDSLSRCLETVASVSGSVRCSACSEQNPQNIVSQSWHNSLNTSPLWLRQTCKHSHFYHRKACFNSS